MKDTPTLDTSLLDDLLSHREDLKREATFVDAAIAADYLRRCADAQPVAWMHADGRVVSASTMDQSYRDGGGMRSSLRDYTIPLYTRPAPVAPQAEPIADSDADYWLRNRQPILDAIERAGFMLMSNASGFWLHPRGTTDAQAEPCIGNDPTCPCQDGDACHYRDAADGTKGWPVPQAEPSRSLAS